MRDVGAVSACASCVEARDALNYSAQRDLRPPADLTMVVPTYNERDRSGRARARAFRARPRAPASTLELVVVDDNSPDGTGAIADDLARTHRMQVIHRAGKLGLGTAVVAGFGAASADIVGVMDADFSHPPALVPQMFAAFQATGADVLVASRYVPGGSTPNWPFKRKLLSRLACLLARPLSPIRDAASGFFLIRRSIARQRDDQGGRLQDLPGAHRARPAGPGGDSVSVRRPRAGREQDEHARGARAISCS